ncbi:MAG: hypothetical protein NUV81_02205 [bacterium]|nr:hypothetical protein [bacterium]
MLILFLSILTLLSTGYVFGTRFAPRHHGIAKGTLGLILALGIQSLFQTAFYYLNIQLSKTTDIFSLIGTAIVAIIAWFSFQQKRENEAGFPSSRSIPKIIAGVILLLASIPIFIFTLQGTASASTGSSILTPWTQLPQNTLLYIALLWLLLFISTIAIKSPLFSAIHSGIALFSVTSITPLIYKVGFGFDGFLHIASERVLLTTGTLSPKPLYYMGQYVFTTWLSRLFTIPIESVDRWLIPILTAILLPLALYLIQQPAPKTETSKKQKSYLFAFLLLPLLPLAPFIATTPQYFSYLLSITALFLLFGVMESRVVHPMAPLILSMWALAIHPLAGLPVLFVALAVLFSERSRLFSGFLILCATLSVPIAFFALSAYSGIRIEWATGALFSPQLWGEQFQRLNPFVGNHFALWPAWAELTQRATPLIFLFFAIGSIFTTRKRWTMVLTLSAVFLWISGAGLHIGSDFQFLIEYERANYADRLQSLAFFCLLPAVLPGFILLIRRIRTSPRFIQISLLIIALLWSSGLAYSAFPRNDALVTGHGWSTSQYDMDAVRLIHMDANGNDYTVLANQSVSASAVSQLGFYRYVNDLFFYPIPTGGPLYQIYLKMTYQEPTRETAYEASVLGKTNLVYVVVNRYWWQASSLSESLRNVADQNWDILTKKEKLNQDDWQIHIYKFDFNNSSSSSSTASE